MHLSLNNALQIAALSDQGMVRGHNEDAVFTDSAQGIVILADGMGGYNAGEVASSMAITALSSELHDAFTVQAPHSTDSDTGYRFAHLCLLEKIARVNALIYEAATTLPACSGMGTTLVAAVFYDNRVAVAHLGDSRLYRLRGNSFGLMTRDHSLLQEQIDSGLVSAEDARSAHNKNLVTRALGVAPSIMAELNDFSVQLDDIYLLCSDGLNDMLDDETIGTVLQAFADDLETAAAQLVQIANGNGGRDNVSVILVKIMQDFPAPESGL